MMDNTRAKLPPVLDATCGGRMMWFDKQHPLALYLDNREIADVELCDGRHFSARILRRWTFAAAERRCRDDKA